MSTPTLFLTIIMIFSMASTLAGCRAEGRSERVEQYRRAPVPVEIVDLYFDAVDRPYTIIATVNAAAPFDAADPDAADARIYQRLRHLAAGYGARAVIVTNSDVDQTTSPPRVRHEGLAIVFTDQGIHDDWPDRDPNPGIERPD